MPHSIPSTTLQTGNEIQMDPEASTTNDKGRSANSAGSDAGENSPETLADDTNEQVMTMEDVGTQGQEAPAASDKVETKPEVKLEDLFADIESDEEFPSSNIRDTKASISPEAPSSPVLVSMPKWPSLLLIVRSNAIPIQSAADSDIMHSFYQRLFPWRYLFQWLNHSPTPTTDFGHREFAFTLQNDAYLRYQSFRTSDL
jgi:DNA primase small subunit